MRTVVLIGPPAAGKSTVGPLLAALLGVLFVDIDDVGESYYSAIGQPLTSLDERVAADGFRRAHRWWQPARVHAATAVLQDLGAAIVAFGAGHAHFEELEYFESVQEALSDRVVVLLLPEEDPTRSLAILRDRCVETKGHEWVTDGHDYPAEWVCSDQNQRLADLVVYSDGLPPDQYAAAIAAASADSGTRPTVGTCGCTGQRRTISRPDLRIEHSVSALIPRPILPAPANQFGVRYHRLDDAVQASVGVNRYCSR